MDIAGAQHPEGEEGHVDNGTSPSTFRGTAPDGLQTPITPVAPVPPQRVHPIIIKCILEAHLSPMKWINSQQFIGFINQEYELQISHK